METEFQAPKKRGRKRQWAKFPVDSNGNPILDGSVAVDATGKRVVIQKPKREVPDAEVLLLIQDRFAVMLKMVGAMIARKVRALIVSGAPGVGKTFSITQLLDEAVKSKKVKLATVKGIVTAINLYMLLYHNRHQHCIVLLDDSDSVFSDEDALNILKAALDTSERRKISWLSSSAILEAANVPPEFEFEGAVIFITNYDFDAWLARSAKGSKLAPHMRALLSRSLYIDLRIHGVRELSLWIAHTLRNSKLLQEKYTLSDRDIADILDYLKRRAADVRSLSIRSAVHLAGLMNLDKKNWRADADVLLVREAEKE